VSRYTAQGKYWLVKVIIDIRNYEAQRPHTHQNPKRYISLVSLLCCKTVVVRCFIWHLGLARQWDEIQSFYDFKKIQHSAVWKCFLVINTTFDVILFHKGGFHCENVFRMVFKVTFLLQLPWSLLKQYNISYTLKFPWSRDEEILSTDVWLHFSILPSKWHWRKTSPKEERVRCQLYFQSIEISRILPPGHAYIHALTPSFVSYLYLSNVSRVKCWLEKLTHQYGFAAWRRRA